MGSTDAKRGQLPDAASVHQLDEGRARRFLRSLTARPFVAVVVEDGEAVVYCKGMTRVRAARIMQELSRKIDEE